jgi:hypothetical protein
VRGWVASRARSAQESFGCIRKKRVKLGFSFQHITSITTFRGPAFDTRTTDTPVHLRCCARGARVLCERRINPRWSRVLDIAQSTMEDTFTRLYETKVGTTKAARKAAFETAYAAPEPPSVEVMKVRCREEYARVWLSFRVNIRLALAIFLTPTLPRAPLSARAEAEQGRQDQPHPGPRPDHRHIREFCVHQWLLRGGGGWQTKRGRTEHCSFIASFSCARCAARRAPLPPQRQGHQGHAAPMRGARACAHLPL